jgi:hypothetical protein
MTEPICGNRPIPGDSLRCTYAAGHDDDDGHYDKDRDVTWPGGTGPIAMIAVPDGVTDRHLSLAAAVSTTGTEQQRVFAVAKAIADAELRGAQHPTCVNCGEVAVDHLAGGKCPTPAGAPANWERHTFEPVAKATLPIDGGLARTLAENTLGLYDEYRSEHGYDEEHARMAAIADVVEGATTVLPEDEAGRPIPELVAEARAIMADTRVTDAGVIERLVDGRWKPVGILPDESEVNPR